MLRIVSSGHVSKFFKIFSELQKHEAHYLKIICIFFRANFFEDKLQSKKNFLYSLLRSKLVVSLHFCLNFDLFFPF